MEHGSQPLKRSPLDHTHRQLGARMVEFAGWELPVQYSDIIGEHLAVRTRAGLFDISHLGELEVRGEGALEFLQGMLTNDLSSLSVGRALYTVMCYEDGGTVDDLYVYRLDRDRYWLVVNAANAEKDLLWLMQHCTAGVVIEDLSAATGKVDLQGPLAQRILQPLVDVDLSQLSRFQFSQSRLAGIDLLISRTGYTGEDGFEIYFPADAAEAVWRAIFAAGQPMGLVPVGLGARDTLRIEAGYCLYGQDLDETISPVEASIGWVVKEGKGDFIGREALAEQKREGPPRLLVAFEMLEQGIPRSHYDVAVDGEVVGMVTSGTFSPTFCKGIGMVLIRCDLANVGQEIDIVIRDRPHRARIAPKPLYPFQGKGIR